jgi:hypothetical protein
MRYSSSKSIKQSHSSSTWELVYKYCTTNVHQYSATVTVLYCTVTASTLKSTDHEVLLSVLFSSIVPCPRHGILHINITIIPEPYRTPLPLSGQKGKADQIEQPELKKIKIEDPRGNFW